MKKKIFLLDGHYLIYRSYHAMKQAGLRDSRGRPTGAIFGLLRFLLKLAEDYQPDYLACALDSKEPTFRHEFFEDYKADRPEMPEDLRVQISRIKKMFEELKIPVVLEPGFESDDLLAAMAEKWAVKTETEVIIVSNDKDLFQLVSENIKVLKQTRGLTETSLLAPEEVETELGVPPGQIQDYLSLVGDKIDNIPGVKGIGSTYATRLLEEFGTVDNILVHLDDISGHLREKIEENRDQLDESRQLVQLRLDAPVELDLSDCEFEVQDFAGLFDFCRELDFRSILENISEITGLEPETGQWEISWQPITPVELVSRVNKDSEPGYLLFTPVNPETKTMAAEEAFLFYLSNSDEEIFITEFSSGSEEKKIFKKLFRQLSNQKFYTFNLKLLYLWALRLKLVPELLTEAFDLQLASYLLAPDSDHNPSEIIRRETEQNLEDFDKSWSRQEKYEWHARIASLIPRLAARLPDRLEEENQTEILIDLEQPLTWILARMEYNGIRIDKFELENFSGELETKLESLRNKAHQKAGEEFNLNSPKQLREILFEKLELPVRGHTDSGKPSTDADSLEQLADKHPLPEIILEYRRYQKVDSTYLSPLVEAVNPRTDKLHTEFNQTVAATGRLSSSRPNLQNIPVREEFGRRVREAFVPSREEFVFLAADYSQIELRILAHFSNDSNLLRAFQEEQDIHTMTAMELTGKQPENIEESDRRVAKVVNYGIAYGLSEFGLARDLDVSQAEAEEYINRYFNRYSKVKEYIDNTVHQAEKDGFVSTLLGRRRYIPGINSDDYFQRQFARRMAVNAPIQGTASDLIKKAMVEIPVTLKNYNCNLLLQIHDELLLEVSQNQVSELESEVRKVMCGALELDVPLVVSAKQGNNWAEVSK